MPQSMYKFERVEKGVTFAVEVRGAVPTFRFVVVARYQGITLFTQHCPHRFIWFPAGRHTLEDTANYEFKTHVAPQAYQLAVKTAHRLKEESYKPFNHV